MQERGSGGQQPSHYGEQDYGDQRYQQPARYEQPASSEDGWDEPAPGYDQRYGQAYEPPYDQRTMEPQRQRYEPAAERPQKSGKPKGLIAASVALVVFAGAAFAVVKSGVLKDDKKPTTQGPAPSTAPKSAGTTAPGPTAPPDSPYSSDVPTISDGTNIVQINHRAVKFPSTVTDATWSPNGLRLAYIDGDGNVATAAADGSDVRVLTKKQAGVKRAHPTWGDGTEVGYVSRQGSGHWLSASAPLQRAATDSDNPADASTFGGPEVDNISHSTAARINPLGSAPDTAEAIQFGKKVVEDAYLREHIDPDASGLGGNPWTAVGDGSDPAIAPDGTVAFVGANGQIWLAGDSYDFTVPAHQITFGVDHPTRPAWSPDGKRIAFQTKTDVESVAADVPAGATANPTRQEYPKPGVPTYQNVGVAPAVLAFAGADATAASVTVSQGKWLNYRDAQTGGSGILTPSGAVIVSSSSSPADIEASAALATSLDDAFYVTPAGRLDQRIVDELTRLFGQHDKRGFRILITGDGSIPASADAAVSAAVGSAPVRVTGVSPYELWAKAAAALAAAPQLDTGAGSAPSLDSPGALFVVADDDRAGLLATLGAVHGIAGTTTSRIVLTQGTTMPAGSQAALDSVSVPGSRVFVVGGHATAAVKSSWPGKSAFTPIVLPGGATPAALGGALAKALPDSFHAAGLYFSARLSAAILPPPTDANLTTEIILAATGQEPVLFADPASGLDANSLAYLKSQASSLIHVDTIGDPTALSQQLAKTLTTPQPVQVLTDPKAAK